MFYILSMLLIAFEFYFLIWYFKSEFFVIEPISLNAPPLIKSMIGLEQCWIMVELSLRIGQSIKQAEKRRMLDVRAYQITEKWISLGRNIVSIIVICFLLSILTTIGV